MSWSRASVFTLVLYLNSATFWLVLEKRWEILLYELVVLLVQAISLRAPCSGCVGQFDQRCIFRPLMLYELCLPMSYELIVLLCWLFPRAPFEWPGRQCEP